MEKCLVCKKELAIIDGRHLKKHNLSSEPAKSRCKLKMQELFLPAFWTVTLANNLLKLFSGMVDYE